MNSYLVHSLSEIERFKDEYEKLEAEGEQEEEEDDQQSTTESTAEASAPLPPSKSWRPGLPATPFPWRTGLVLAVINFNEGFQMSLIAPFAPFLVGYYFGQDDPQLGFYVSCLLSAFFFGQFLTAAPWGRLSDRLGRKPILLAGLFFSGFSVVLFGLGFSFPVVMVARFLGGCLNGNVGITRSYMGEITDRSNQTTGYSVLNVAWTTGSMIGPLVGGFFTFPADNLPYFDTQFWQDYPFLLPCFLSCFISCLGAFLGLFLLSESKVWQASRALKLKEEDLLQQTSDGPSGSNNAAVKLSSLAYQNSDLSKSFLEKHDATNLNLKLKSFSNSSSMDGLENTTEKAPTLGSGGAKENQPLLSDSIETPPCIWTCFCLSARSICCEKLLHKVVLFMPKGIQDRDVILCSFLWALCGAGVSMHDSIIAVYLQTNIDEGGLGWNVDQIGVLLSIQGVAFVIWQVLFYRIFNQYLGHVGSSSAATFSLGLYAALLPTTTFMAQKFSSLSIWIIMILLISVRAAMGTSQGTAAITLINNSARAENRGAVNGFAQSIGALMRAFAPLLAGLLYSLSLEARFVLAPFAAFIVISAFFWSASLFALQLPRSLNAPKAK